jgi:hypothetical protein
MTNNLNYCISRNFLVMGISADMLIGSQFGIGDDLEWEEEEIEDSEEEDSVTDTMQTLRELVMLRQNDPNIWLNVASRYPEWAAFIERNEAAVAHLLQ